MVMDELTAPQQNRLLAGLSNLLRRVEQDSGPEFLPRGLDVMGLVRQLALPSAETVEKMSYGDPLFRMPTQSNIPITTDRGYLAEVLGMLPAVPAASRATTRLSNEAADALVRQITRNPEATAPRVLEETSMPFMQAVAPKTPVSPSLVEPSRSQMGFYSQLEAATIPLQNKGTGEQYLAQLQKSAGVKPEEIKWTGLDEFLTGKDSVTKQEIQDYLQANRVDVQEVVRQDYTPSRAEILEFMKTERGKGLKYDEAENELYLDKLGTNSRFPEYQLRGGRNYREILLTLPARERVVETQVLAGKRPRVFENTATGRFELLDPYGEPSAVFNTLAEAEKAADEISAPFVKSETVRDPGFYSTHFDQPNILAHMRVNDRTVGGKKTLFIEEIQSDWHQAGRKQGYQEDYDPRKKGVPDAPFKTSWHELTLKRAIQEASEKGYDQIAFTTGRTQAKRYDIEDASGMKGFYDNILPKSLEKLGKKFDAKVGKTKVGGVEVWQMDITPQMRESVTTKGQPLFAVPAVGAGLLGAGMYQDEQMF
jgi:hypothetical protein